VLGISSSEVQAALAFIEKHKQEVLADYQAILERHAQGNAPEIEVLRKQSHAKLLALKRYRGTGRLYLP
jgi:hypothetical protein